MEHRFLDLSALALTEPSEKLPFSLGLRSQTLSLKRVSAETEGRFVKPAGFKEALGQAENRITQVRGKSEAVFSEDIGETLSLIYSPFYIRDDVLADAILNTPAAAGTDFSAKHLDFCRPEKETVFVSGLCPSCGWDLEGSADSLVLVCRNCHTLWKARNHRLDKIRFGCAPPNSQEDAMLPFWRIRASITGRTPLKSYADLVRTANLPKAVQPDMETRPLHFWAPAFKIRPQIFLRLCSQLLIGQPRDKLTKKISANPLMPVTLPASEAIQSIKITLATLLRPLRDHLPGLPDMIVRPDHVMLVFLPFEPGHQEYCHPGLNVAVNKNILTLSANL